MFMTNLHTNFTTGSYDGDLQLLLKIAENNQLRLNPTNTTALTLHDVAGNPTIGYGYDLVENRGGAASALRNVGVTVTAAQESAILGLTKGDRLELSGLKDAIRKLMLPCLLGAFGFSCHAGIASNEMSQKHVACGEFSSYSQISACHQGLLTESDALLNQEYKALADYLKGSDRKNLVDAQRKWVKFRNADCYFSDPRSNDVVAGANKSACLTNRTIERLKHLEEYNAPSNKGCNGCPW